MLTSIAFDHQTMVKGNEVRDIGTNRLLPPEFRTGNLAIP